MITVRGYQGANIDEREKSFKKILENWKKKKEKKKVSLKHRSNSHQSSPKVCIIKNHSLGKHNDGMILGYA